MDIIPHNPDIVQVGMIGHTDDLPTFVDFPQISAKKGMNTQEAAYALYDLGFNVFPQPIGKKGGYAWKRLQFARLSRHHDDYGLESLFAGDTNIAIMCGRTSDNLFVIDCETHDSLTYHMKQLRKRAIPLWVSQTARGGHIYLFAENGEVHNIAPNILWGAEIKGCNGYVLAPPSIHPTGAVYEWLLQEGDTPPTVHTKQIDWLEDCTGQHITLDVTPNPQQTRKGNWAYPVISPASNLSHATRDYIHNGHRTAEGNRNNSLFAAACDMNGCGYSHSEAEAILLGVAITSGLPAYEAKTTINSAYNQARTPSRPITHKTSDNSIWRNVLLWTTRHKWHSKTSATDRALFLALIERCRVGSNENGVFRASIRELAVLARLGVNTVQNALKRLEACHFIIQVGYDKNSQASLWVFDERLINRGKQIELNLDTVSIPPHWLRYSDSIFNSDITERGALGHSVLYVYYYLMMLEEPAMPSEIAEMLGVSVNQVNYAIRKLRVYDLVERLDEGWFAAERVQAYLNQLAAQIGTYGKGEARRNRFLEERRVFAGRLLFASRLKREGHVFIDAFHRQREVKRLLDDPLVALGLELGGVIALKSGGYLMADDERRH